MSLLIDPDDFEASYQQRNAADIQREANAEKAISDMADEYGDAIRLLWARGNGAGGGIMQMLAGRLGLPTSYQRPPAAYSKAKISGDLRRAVFERDAYRCVTCAGFLDLTCDHRIPESKGGPTTLENLQTMCRPCNSRKGARND